MFWPPAESSPTAFDFTASAFCLCQTAEHRGGSKHISVSYWSILRTKRAGRGATATVKVTLDSQRREIGAVYRACVSELKKVKERLKWAQGREPQRQISDRAICDYVKADWNAAVKCSWGLNIILFLVLLLMQKGALNKLVLMDA